MSKPLDPRIEAYRDRIIDVLKTDDYTAAERIIVEGAQALGYDAARHLYPLAWERAMAAGRGRLRAYFLTEQAAWDADNRAGETIRRAQLELASTPKGRRDSFVSGRALAELAANPAVEASWPIWEDCIRLLQAYVTGALKNGESEADTTLQRDFPTLLTAGSGRSGSSAIYDWLVSFVGVEGTRAQHFHIKDALFTLATQPGTTEYKQHVVDYFWGTFFGRMIYASKANYRKIALARSFSSSKKQVEAATACRRILSTMAHAQADKAVDLQSIFDSVIGMFAPPQTQFIGNGWLDFHLAHGYRHLDRSLILCSIRDPRDIYAEHLLLTRTFNPDVGKFIEDYRFKLETLEQALAEQPGNVIVLRFEEFVRSEQTRRSLAERVGVDPDGARKKPGRFPFIPEKSAMNIGVHQACADQAAIGQIGEALSKYCHKEAVTAA